MLCLRQCSEPELKAHVLHADVEKVGLMPR